MSGMNRVIASASVLAVVLVASGRAEAVDGYCASGAVNTITGNYASAGTGAARDGDQGLTAAPRCEICLIVRVPEDGAPGRWEEVAQVCNIWSDAAAHDVMFRIGQCGLIVPAFERAGAFYGSNVPIRIEAVHQPPCQ